MRIPEISITEKYNLSVYEAAAYFNIDERRLRELIEMKQGRFAFVCGNRTLIVRHKLEDFIDDLFEIDEQGREMKKNAKTKPRQKRTTQSK